MVFLGPKDAQIEVRLVKPPFEATDSDRVYIDEYEQLGTPHREKGLFECHRYIASEDTKYSIEVTLKKGFTWGDYLGIRVHIEDRARKARVGFGLIDKVGNENVNEDLRLETNVPGIEPSDLGGFNIEAYRYGESTYEQVSESQHQKQMREYQARLATHASKVDEKSFTKHGITHNIAVEGGVERPLNPPPKFQYLHTGSKKVHFHYFCRSLDSLEENSFYKCPIPLEFQPWDSLKDHERQSCFKALQAYDKEALLKHNILEAGPEADAKVIHRQLLELGDIPNHWRGWGQLYTRERQKLFEHLQRRRKFWEKGELPPEERKQEPDEKPSTAPAASQSSIKEEPVNTPAQTPPVQTPQTTIKEEPVEAPVFPKSKETQPEIIILDDTPPQSSKRKATNVSDIPTPTIKVEPVDLDNVRIMAPLSNLRALEGGPQKRAKFEPDVAGPSANDDEELLKLKEEEEREMEELLAAQRVQELIRKRNERKAKIAALEARASGTPRHGSPL
ncbi:hypothetical protein V8E51_011069 [Hyaloscypha variabilis]